jgi:tRNA1Val (adenine37-N6)-methyltransferase
MKLNTDGVLLGAWANASDVKHILDIGTGTGVIALMMAQKTQTALIDAIDIDHDAYLQARSNFEENKWAERLDIFHTSLQDFDPGKKYDLIISNPPYFIDDSKTGDYQKDIAKHSISLTYAELIVGIDRLLADDGRAFLVLPIFNLGLLKSRLEDLNLFITAIIDVTAVSGRQAYLCLILLERVKKELQKDTITIQNSHENFTEEYKALTKDFYLKF